MEKHKYRSLKSNVVIIIIRFITLIVLIYALIFPSAPLDIVILYISLLVITCFYFVVTIIEVRIYTGMKINLKFIIILIDNYQKEYFDGNEEEMQQIEVSILDVLLDLVRLDSRKKLAPFAKRIALIMTNPCNIEMKIDIYEATVDYVPKHFKEVFYRMIVSDFDFELNLEFFL